MTTLIASQEDIELLKTLAPHHYDGECRTLEKRGVLERLSKGQPLENREIQTVAKTCEIARHLDEPERLRAAAIMLRCKATLSQTNS